MGEHLLRVLLSELAFVRIRCANCRTAIEMAVEKIGELDNKKCPGCDWLFGRGIEDMKSALHGESVDRLRALSHAIDEIKRMNKLFTVEFPVRLDDREEAAK
jgi:arginine utilization protein RocB